MARAKKTEKTATAEPVQVEESKRRYTGWDMSRIFWGLLLILVGVFVLLDNLNVIEVQYQNIWQLWPLLIVGWGVSLLNIKGTLWSILSAVLMLGIIGLLAWVAIDGGPFEQQQSRSDAQTQQVARESDAIKNVDVAVRAGAGKLKIDSQSNDTPVLAKLYSDFTELDVDSKVDGTTQRVDLTTSGSRMWWSGSFRNDLDITLTRNLPLNLNVRAGAADVDADVSQVVLERFDLDVGASSSVVTLGNRVDELDVRLNAGASSVTFRVPKDSGVRVELDKGISSQNLDGLTEVGEGRYETADYATAAKKISIRGDIGATSFELERY